jgi:CRP-like cAMP-binding protein
MIQEGFLKFLERKEVLFWMSYGTLEEFPKGSVLFYRDHFPIGLYILFEGAIDVNYMNARKRRQIHITEPVMLGLNYLLHTTPYNHSVEITDSSKIIFIPKKKIISEIQKTDLAE